MCFSIKEKEKVNFINYWPFTTYLWKVNEEHVCFATKHFICPETFIEFTVIVPSILIYHMRVRPLVNTIMVSSSVGLIS